MGIFSRKGHGDDGNPDRLKRRKHFIIPWIESPLIGAADEYFVFQQRHEANSVELFFDLFFVANLATFTAYHSITNRDELLAYIGFFSILWSSWYQITLHDVRFARDSVYERVCKTIQFGCFVALALVGSGFYPGSVKSNNTNFRILCYTLMSMRVLSTVQYAVVFIFTARAGQRYRKLLIPLGLHIATFAIAAVVFGSLVPGYPRGEEHNQGTYAAWWVVMLFEGISILITASKWRMLSFKKTHIVERMGLLTLIVVGEGAIGATKTIGRLMGKGGLDLEACGFVLCIVLVLVFIWMLYFDNHPTGHYGTIRQQIWAVLHFPLHLSIVGVVEGAQQLAAARYVIRGLDKFDKSLFEYCHVQELDAITLRTKLTQAIEYYQFNSKPESAIERALVYDQLYVLGNVTNACTEWPQSQEAKDAAELLLHRMMGAIYATLGIQVAWEEDMAVVAVDSWKIVYIYYWASMLVLVLVMTMLLYLIRKHRADVFEWISMISRAIVFVICALFLAVAASDDILYGMISTTALVPTVMGLLFLLNVLDRSGKVLANWRLNRTGEDYVDESLEHGHASEDHAGSGQSHHSGHVHGHKHVSSDYALLANDKKSNSDFSAHLLSPLQASTDAHHNGPTTPPIPLYSMPSAPIGSYSPPEPPLYDAHQTMYDGHQYQAYTPMTHGHSAV